MITLVKKREAITVADVDDLISHMMTLPTVELSEAEKNVAGIVAPLLKEAPHAADSINTKKKIVELANQVSQQWQQYKARNEVYTHAEAPILASETERAEIAAFNKSLGDFQKLVKSEQHINILRKLALSVRAFNEQTITVIDDEGKEHIQDSTVDDEAKLIQLRFMLKELLKLEVAQLEKLEDAQQIRRAELNQKSELLKKTKQELAAAIQKRSEKFSDTIDPSTKPNSYMFFRKQEQRWHLGKYADQTSQLGLFTHLASNILNFAMRISHFIPIAIHGLAVTSSALLSALPWVSTASSTVPTLINEIIKPSIKRKNRNYLAVVIGGLLGLIGSTVLIGLIPAIAVASTYIGLGLLTLGTFQYSILPVIKLFNEISNRKKTSKACDDLLAKPTQFPLSRIQKQILLLNLEKMAAKLRSTNTPSIGQRDPQKDFTIQLLKARKAIISGEVDLLQNPVIQLMLHGNSDKNTFNNFMRNETLVYQATVEQDILRLKKEAAIATLTMVGSTLSLAAAVLLLIPTPVTWAIAAGLIVVNAGICIGVKYNLFDKIIDKFISKSSEQANASKKTPLGSSAEVTLRLSEKNLATSELALTPQVYPPVAPKPVPSYTTDHETRPSQNHRDVLAFESFGPANPTSKM